MTTGDTVCEFVSGENPIVLYTSHLGKLFKQQINTVVVSCMSRRKESLPFSSEMKQAGENAAARMFDGGFAKDTSDLSHFHSLVNSSASLKIKKRDAT